jgi:hypothetical protein
MHFRLEVIEQRIQDGRDLAHLHHPALAVRAVFDYDYGELTDSEKYAKARYETIEENGKIPSFWAPREWDEIGRTLSAAESAGLRSRIEVAQTGMRAKRKRTKRTTEDEFVAVSDESEYSGDEEFTVAEEEREEVEVKLKIRTRANRRAVIPVEIEPKRRVAMWKCSTKLFGTDDDEDGTDFSVF